MFFHVLIHKTAYKVTDIERTDSGVGSEASADSSGSVVNGKARRRSKEAARAGYLQNMLDVGGEESKVRQSGNWCDDCEQRLENERSVES